MILVPTTIWKMSCITNFVDDLYYIQHMISYFRCRRFLSIHASSNTMMTCVSSLVNEFNIYSMFS